MCQQLQIDCIEGADKRLFKTFSVKVQIGPSLLVLITISLSDSLTLILSKSTSLNFPVDFNGVNMNKLPTNTFICPTAATLVIVGYVMMGESIYIMEDLTQGCKNKKLQTGFN